MTRTLVVGVVLIIVLMIIFALVGGCSTSHGPQQIQRQDANQAIAAQEAAVHDAIQAAWANGTALTDQMLDSAIRAASPAP